jgi:membrane protein DedA with SNARE-associated domain
MESIYDLLHYLNPKVLIDTLLGIFGNWVYLALWFVVFAETGLAVGFFLPGDSLLVVAGLFAAANKLNVIFVLIAFFLGSVIGDSTGYWTGRTMGHALFAQEGLSHFQTEPRPKGSRVLRKIRTEDGDTGSICPDRQDVCSARGRSGGNEVFDLPYV